MTISYSEAKPHLDALVEKHHGNNTRAMASIGYSGSVITGWRNKSEVPVTAVMAAMWELGSDQTETFELTRDVLKQLVPVLAAAGKYDLVTWVSQVLAKNS